MNLDTAMLHGVGTSHYNIINSKSLKWILRNAVHFVWLSLQL